MRVSQNKNFVVIPSSKFPKLFTLFENLHNYSVKNYLSYRKFL